MQAPSEDLASPALAAERSGTQQNVSTAGQPAERSLLGEVGRQVGLTARFGLEGAAQAAQVVTEPIRHAIVNPAARALGMNEAAPLSMAAARVADAVGLPKPETAQERVVGDASRMVAGAGAFAGAGAAASQLPGMVGKAGAVIAANPAQQVASAAGAGLAGGAVREAGGGELAQAGAAMVAGVGAGLGADAAARLGKGVFRRIMADRGGRVDGQINEALQRAGVALDDVPESIRQSLRADVEKALKTGTDLNADALRRLVDFKRVPGATPTRGSLTLDPVQVTRERNLAKSGANATDAGLQGLARVENQNNAALVNALNTAGAGTADDAYVVGEKAISSLQRGLDAEKATVNALYQKARDSSGRSFPLDGNAFTKAANKALDDALLGQALPPSVATHMNRIATGEVPFTVDYAEQLKTAMGNLRRATSDGQTRMALDKVRAALDDAPVLGLGQQTPAAGARPVNPGNLPAVPGAPQLGEEAVAAFTEARKANAAMMKRIEGNPALKAIYDGEVAPEDFVRKFVVGSSANVFAVGKLGNELAKDPAAQQAVRGSVVAWLKERAVGTGVADETARFNALRYRQALATIGDRKLKSLGFGAEEIEQLKAVGRVGTYTTHQPVGSAVNNSNSGALLLGRSFDALDAIASRLPLLNLGPQISAVTRGVQQSQAQNIAPALVRPGQLPAPIGQRLAPAITAGGVFTLPASEDRQDGPRQ
ncbi:MAG: hypothetical protein Q8S02_12355 [Hydrogenophaga sp.]|nr:hypothetical protein [Hydrogenophaga sp.]